MQDAVFIGDGGNPGLSVSAIVTGGIVHYDIFSELSVGGLLQDFMA